MRKINQIYTMRSPRNQRVAGYWFIFRPDRKRWPRQGRNRIEVTLLERDPEVTPPIEFRGRGVGGPVPAGEERREGPGPGRSGT